MRVSARTAAAIASRSWPSGIVGVIARQRRHANRRCAPAAAVAIGNTAKPNSENTIDALASAKHCAISISNSCEPLPSVICAGVDAEMRRQCRLQRTALRIGIAQDFRQCRLRSPRARADSDRADFRSSRVRPARCRSACAAPADRGRDRRRRVRVLPRSRERCRPVVGQRVERAHNTATGYEPRILISAVCGSSSASAFFIGTSSMWPARSMKNAYSHFA